MKQTIRLTESQLTEVISKTVKKVLRERTLNELRSFNKQIVKEQSEETYLNSKIDDLIGMLLRKEKNQDIYLEGFEAIKNKYGHKIWESDFGRFRKMMRKWMNDEEASTLLPKYIVDEYQEVTESY